MKLVSLTVAGALGILCATFATPAGAAVEPCGGLEILASSECELVAEGGCVAMCTPLTVQASCAADLYVGCQAQCTASADVACTGSCSASCEAECQVNPAQFDCVGSCEARCDGSCSASCAGSANAAQCMASCQATCSGDCDVSCQVTAPSATCDAKCEASCEGSCTASANIDCQADCQASGFATCTATIEGGCEAQCTEPGGALFCDGQYVDADNLAACLAYLESQLQIDVQGWATGECVGTTCSAEAGATFSCRTAPGRSASPWAALAGLALAGAIVLARRR